MPTDGRRAVASRGWRCRSSRVPPCARCGRRRGSVEQPAALDQRRAARAASPRRRTARWPGPSAVGAVVDQRERRVGDLLALAPGEQRAPALDGVGGEHRADEADERGGDERVEHDRAAAALRLARAHERERALGGLGADRLRVERRRVAADARRRGRSSGRRPRRRRPSVGPRAGRLVARPRSRASWRARPRPSRVRVDGVLDLGDALARAGGALDRQRQLHLPLGATSRASSGEARPVDVGGAPNSSGRPANSSGSATAAASTRRRRDRARRPSSLEVGAVGVAGAAVDERAHADAAAAGVAEALDLAVVHADLPAGALLGPGLGVARAGGERRLDARAGRRPRGSALTPPSRPRSARGCARAAGRRPAGTAGPPLPQ